jgi:hypothetical protein
MDIRATKSSEKVARPCRKRKCQSKKIVTEVVAGDEIKLRNLSAGQGYSAASLLQHGEHLDQCSFTSDL